MIKTSVKTDREIPRYLEVARNLQHAIETKQYNVGNLLPAEIALQKQYNVSRCTVREALRLLRDQGYISSVKGSGSKVISSTPPRQYLQTMESINELIKFQLSAISCLVSKNIEPLPQALTKYIDVPPEKEWLKVTLLRKLIKCQSPVMLSSIYIDEKYKDIQERIDCPQIFLDVLKNLYHVELVELKQDIRAIELNKEQMRIFDYPDKTAALQATRQYYDKHLKLFLITVDITPADRYFYSNCMKICVQN